jgi:hypothetical protein
VIDDEAVAPRRLCDARVEWPPILRQTADERQDPVPHLLLTRLSSRRIADCRHLLRPVTELSLRNRIQLGEQRGPGLLRVRQRHGGHQCDNDHDRATRRHLDLLFCSGYDE